jgi:RNA polymerase sigma-70 factor (ECF subfamily)
VRPLTPLTLTLHRCSKGTTEPNSLEPKPFGSNTSWAVSDAATERHLRMGASSPGTQGEGRVLLFPDIPLGEADDASIARILIEGDRSAPRVAWHRFAPMVHRMLKRAFGPEHEIDDLVQDVFLTLFARVHTLREPQALRAFLIAITAHTIRYELRRKAALRWLRFGEPADAKAVDADLDSREAVVRLYRILDRLGSDDRTAFVLRFMEGLELTEVSHALGVSLATAKRRLARAWRRVVIGAQRDGALVEYLDVLGTGAVP